MITVGARRIRVISDGSELAQRVPYLTECLRGRTLHVRALKKATPKDGFSFRGSIRLPECSEDAEFARNSE